MLTSCEEHGISQSSLPSEAASGVAVDSHETTHTVHDKRLKAFAEQLSKLTSQRIRVAIETERQAQHETRRQAQAQAQARYEEARARGERVRPPERPKIDVPEEIESLFPALRHDQLIAELYPQSDEKSYLFIRPDGTLSPLGQVVLDTVQTADDHALDASSFGLDAIKEAASRYQKLARLDVGIRLEPRECAVLERILSDTGVVSGTETLTFDAFRSLGEAQAFDKLLNALIGMEHSPIPRIAATYRTWYARKQYLTSYLERLEYALAGLLLDWAEVIRFGDVEKFSKEEYAQYTTADAPNDIHPRHYDAIIEDRLRAFYETMIQGGKPSDAETLTAQLDALLPAHPQYQRLQKVRERYREIVAQGGWSELKPDNMHFGGRAPLVTALKKRLAAEGYYEGAFDDLYDDALKKGIASYQVHHQLDVTDEIDRTFWKSINVRAEQRLLEIEANIRRWHRTMYVPKDRYIYINIPSFTVELWDAGKRVATHNVIVGNSTKICNARTREWELMNATHLLHSRMTYIVFNPYWNVPPRIEVDEYGKKMAENPKWLEESDFEYYTPKGGGRVLRQKPGPNNALGKVKLIFPNRYNIYLHDTPKQSMFSYTVRAFSHGCMRVQDAMGFAKSVLTVDGQWDEDKVERYFVEKGEHAVDLLQPIDVFIEYHTVTVDDEGKPYFLADVYRIIKNMLHPPTPQERACDPAIDRVSNFRSGVTNVDSGP